MSEIINYVFVILWHGKPFVFKHYTDACVWLREKVPYLESDDLRNFIDEIPLY